MASDESHSNVSLSVGDKVTRQCPQTTTFLQRREPKRYWTEVLPLTSLPPYRQAKPALYTHILPWTYIYRFIAQAIFVSQFDIMVRLVSRGTSVQIHCSSPFSSKVVVCGHRLVILSLTIKETLKWFSSLPILTQESFWWWQCSDRYIIYLSPHLRTPFPRP